jgi:hypothetical protein
MQINKIPTLHTISSSSTSGVERFFFVDAGLALFRFLLARKATDALFTIDKFKHEKYL